MLLRHDARQSRDDLLDINLSLPFQSEVNTGFGVLAKVYLDALTHINNGQRVRDPNAEGVKDAKTMALEICEETFVGVKYPKAEVERGFRFWDVVSPFSVLFTFSCCFTSAFVTGRYTDDDDFLFVYSLFFSTMCSSLRHPTTSFRILRFSLGRRIIDGVFRNWVGGFIVCVPTCLRFSATPFGFDAALGYLSFIFVYRRLLPCGNSTLRARCCES